MKKKTIIIIVAVIVIVLFAGIIIAGLSGALDEEQQTTLSQTTEKANNDISENDTEKTTSNNGVLHGELISIIENEDIAVVKVKISRSYSNKATIDQNYYNVSDLIKNKNCNKYSEIQYWAIADMDDGSEQKVISFTLNSDTIKKIYNNEIVDNQIGSYAEELWVHPSLEEQ